MKNVIKVWNRIVVIVSVIIFALLIIFAEETGPRIALCVALALRVTFASLTSMSLETNRKSITLGVLDTILYFPVIGVLYLIWNPRGGKTYL